MGRLSCGSVDFIAAIAANIREGRYDETDLLDVIEACNERLELRRAAALAAAREAYGPHYEIHVTPVEVGVDLARAEGVRAIPRVATEAEDIDRLARHACEDARLGEVRLLIEYVDSQGDRSRRAIEPVAIKDSRWEADVHYLWARDVEKDAHRNFRLDRIQRLEVCE